MRIEKICLPKNYPKNKLEGISVNTSISCSSCHQDQHNGREGTYAWTISCYAYMETKKVGLTPEDVRWGRRIVIVGYSKAICESRKGMQLM